MQERDSWSDFDATNTAIPLIKAVQNNDYILTVTYAGTTLTVASSFAIPCLDPALLPATAVCNNMHLTLDPNLMDFGRNMLVVVSPIDCSAVTSKTSISGPSVRFYAMDTVADIDVLPADAIIDSTQTYDLLGNVTGGTAVNYLKGWTCVDMPFTTAWTAGSQAWTYT